MALHTNHRARPVPGTFAAELVRLRDKAGLSQSRLAARAGYDHSYISRLESGYRAPARSAVLTDYWRWAMQADDEGGNE